MTWNILKSGLVYFALVFGAGFFLGTIRVLAIEPLIGVRYAELLETPFMLIVVYLSAKFVVSKMSALTGKLPCFIVGVLALVFLLLLEFTLVLGLQNMSIQQYFESRDKIAFSTYIISLTLFAFMPLLIKVKKHHKDA